jgi:hypothetical protein
VVGLEVDAVGANVGEKVGPAVGFAVRAVGVLEGPTVGTDVGAAAVRPELGEYVGS